MKALLHKVKASVFVFAGVISLIALIYFFVPIDQTNAYYTNCSPNRWCTTRTSYVTEIRYLTPARPNINCYSNSSCSRGVTRRYYTQCNYNCYSQTRSYSPQTTTYYRTVRTSPVTTIYYRRTYTAYPTYRY